MSVSIVGGGLAGCLLACYLARRGTQVTLYERRPDPRSGSVERGRSINLALSERGLDALRRIGLAEQVLKEALPMRGRMIHPVTADGEAGELDFQPYSASGDRAINSISRGALNSALLDAALGYPGVTAHFEHRLTELDPESGAMTFLLPDGGSTVITGEVILGTDGAGSAVRSELVRRGLVSEQVDFLDHGYKELTIAPGDGDWPLDPGALHIWPRGQAMMIALPNPDKSFTGTLFWPNDSFPELADAAAVIEHFGRIYPDVPEIAPELADDYARNPIGQLGTVRCTPWHVIGAGSGATPGAVVGLLGDAAHAIVPFYGQGANAAFEDVVELDRCLAETAGPDGEDSWSEALALFERRRMVNTEAIAQMALENFVEMRDKVASPVYQWQKKLEHVLENALPGRYVSRYELVSFSTVPYAQVQRRVRRQRQVLGAVIGGAALLLGAAAAALLGRRRR